MRNVPGSWHAWKEAGIRSIVTRLRKKQRSSRANMITREKEPPNLEMPFSALESLVTPTERFYVRCHFPIPKINEREWRLKVEGKVARPFEMTMDELREMPTQTIMATIECAGNSRVFLVPKVKGVQWELGAVGNAEWTGVRLRDVLERAGIADECA